MQQGSLQVLSTGVKAEQVLVAPWVLAALQLFAHLWQLLLSPEAAAIAFKLMMQLGLI